MRRCVLVGIAALVCLAAGRSAWGYHIEVRFVRSTSPIDPSIPNNTLFTSPGTSNRIRIQFGVFDDDAGPAPAGGFVGWNVGTLSMTGGTNTRTPGRIAPWNFAPNPPGNGLPSTDPFTALTAIDATLGTQSSFWGCDPYFQPLPQPPPVIRGRNVFASLFEFTTVTGTVDYDAVFAGNLIVASGWGTIGTPTPPDCSDPTNPIPGSVLYAPMTLPPVPFTVTLHIVIPAPGAAWMLGIGALGAIRRRRGFTSEYAEERHV